MGDLYALLPNFTEVLDDVKRHVALSQDCQDGLQVTPILLLGLPGIETHFAKRLADLLGTGMNLVPMSSMTGGQAGCSLGLHRNGKAPSLVKFLKPSLTANMRTR